MTKRKNTAPVRVPESVQDLNIASAPPRAFISVVPFGTVPDPRAAAARDILATVATKTSLGDLCTTTALPALRLGAEPARENDVAFSDDLLIGADEIRRFVFGDRKTRRSVYHLCTSSKNFPCLKLGSRWAARRSALRAWVIAEEKRRTGRC